MPNDAHEPAKLTLDPAAHDALTPELRHSAEQLFPVFYAQVRRLARRERLRVGADQTAGHGADPRSLPAAPRVLARPGRRALSAAPALSMRHVLINHARDSVAAKRGGGAAHVPLEFAENETTVRVVAYRDGQRLGLSCAGARM